MVVVVGTRSASDCHRLHIFFSVFALSTCISVANTCIGLARSKTLVSIIFWLHIYSRSCARNHGFVNLSQSSVRSRQAAFPSFSFGISCRPRFRTLKKAQTPVWAHSRLCRCLSLPFCGRAGGEVPNASLPRRASCTAYPLGGFWGAFCGLGGRPQVSERRFQVARASAGFGDYAAVRSLELWANHTARTCQNYGQVGCHIGLRGFNFRV